MPNQAVPSPGTLGPSIAEPSRPSRSEPRDAGPDPATLSKPLSQLRQARARLSDVRRVLAAASTPEEIRDCAPLLEEAILALQAIPSRADGFLLSSSVPDHADETSGELAREFEALQFELGVVRRLIEGGADFYRGWARILAAVLTGYTPSGEPAALTARGSVSLEG